MAGVELAEKSILALKATTGLIGCEIAEGYLKDILDPLRNGGGAVFHPALLPRKNELKPPTAIVEQQDPLGQLHGGRQISHAARKSA